MSESYVEVFAGKVDFPKPFQRTGKFPIDRTSMFSSYEDAIKYAAGDRTNPDSRGLCGTSYVGQTITVYEKGVVTDYKIQPDRSLKELVASSFGSARGSLAAGELTSSVTLPEGCTPLDISVYDSLTGEKLFTDVSYLGSIVTVSLAEAYINPIDIVVSYFIN